LFICIVGQLLRERAVRVERTCVQYDEEDYDDHANKLAFDADILDERRNLHTDLLVVKNSC